MLATRAGGIFLFTKILSSLPDVPLPGVEGRQRVAVIVSFQPVIALLVGRLALTLFGQCFLCLLIQGISLRHPIRQG